MAPHQPSFLAPGASSRPGQAEGSAGSGTSAADCWPQSDKQSRQNLVPAHSAFRAANQQKGPAAEPVVQQLPALCQHTTGITQHRQQAAEAFRDAVPVPTERHYSAQRLGTSGSREGTNGPASRPPQMCVAGPSAPLQRKENDPPSGVFGKFALPCKQVTPLLDIGPCNMTSFMPRPPIHRRWHLLHVCGYCMKMLLYYLLIKLDPAAIAECNSPYSSVWQASSACSGEAAAEAATAAPTGIQHAALRQPQDGSGECCGSQHLLPSLHHGRLEPVRAST